MIVMMNNPINQGTNCSTTVEWINATKDMKLTSFDPSAVVNAAAFEPGAAVNISVADRKRMDQALPGVYTAPECL